MVRARVVLQLALATVAAMLSLYFWLRAIGGEPTAPVAQEPIPRFEGHIVHAVVVRPRARPHASERHRRVRAAHVTLRLAASRTAVGHPATSLAAPAQRSGGASSAPPVTRTTPTPPAASPPPPPSPPSPPS